MAWRMIGQPYSMPPQKVQLIPPFRQADMPEWWSPVIGQKDFRGNLIFQHRGHPKWILFGVNPHYPQFRYEAECLAFLDELAQVWDGRVSTLRLRVPEPCPDPSARWFRYVRLSWDERLLEFLPDGRIRSGGTISERHWRAARRRGVEEMEIIGKDVLTCRLEKQSDGVWRGRWHFHERVPVELIPLPAPVEQTLRFWQDLKSWMRWRSLG